MFEESIFEDANAGVIDPQEIINVIDMEQIDSVALTTAQSMCKDLTEVYFNEDFMKDHPSIKKRLDTEIESLRVLVKMRKSDEQVHDLAVQAISANSSNASLYRSLAQIQGSLLSIQKQIDDTVRNIQNICKNCQLDIDFHREEEDKEEEKDMGSISRGAKAFIEEMQQEKEEVE